MSHRWWALAPDRAGLLARIRCCPDGAALPHHPVRRPEGEDQQDCSGDGEDERADPVGFSEVEPPDEASDKRTPDPGEDRAEHAKRVAAGKDPFPTPTAATRCW